jgi:hypothetical protein
MPTLNIAHNTRLLVILALNSTMTVKGAARALGVHEDTLYKMKKRYGVKWDRELRKWVTSTPASTH